MFKISPPEDNRDYRLVWFRQNHITELTTAPDDFVIDSSDCVNLRSKLSKTMLSRVGYATFLPLTIFNYAS